MLCDNVIFFARVVVLVIMMLTEMATIMVKKPKPEKEERRPTQEGLLSYGPESREHLG